jgi:stress-induced-phosphoprotein 1
MPPCLQAIQHDPTDHVFFSNRSAAYLSKGDTSDALADAEACVKLNPKWGKGFSRKGAALHALQRYEEAIRTYEEGIAVDPSNEGLKTGLADAREAQFASQSAPRPGAFGGPGKAVSRAT